MMKNIFTLFICILVLKLASCARIGSPTGGPKDSIPPVMAIAKPLNKTTSFKDKKITIFFNEYVKFKNLNAQLIISPPMEKKPIIKPEVGVSKKISIEFLEALEPNTTYSINFGNSIVDNNEGNELGRFSYVFSTGKELDSLVISGNIQDPIAKEKIENISVLAYKNANDTLIGKHAPTYLTNTLKSDFFSLENLSEGNYKIIALEDKNNNYLYDKGKERIGFVQNSFDINQNKDSLTMVLFREAKDNKLYRPKQTKGNQIIMGFQGKDSLEISLTGLLKDQYFISKEIDKDSVYIWFKELPLDSITINSKIDTLQEFYTVSPRDLKKDSLLISNTTESTLHPNNALRISSNIPIVKFNKDSIVLLKNDSISIPFQVSLKSRMHTIEVDFERETNNVYSLLLKQEAFTDYLENTSKAKKIQFATLDPEEYGELILDFKNPNNKNIIVWLLQNNKIEQTQYIHSSDKVSFKNLVPAEYTIRYVLDDNNNQKFDNGSFEHRRQPETIINFGKKIMVRANSEINEILNVD